VSTADLLARWAESSREVEKLRRTSDVLAERERRAVLALRNARDELAAARDREDGFQERTTELRSEIRRMHETLGWRLVEPLRAGRRLLARGVRARGIDQA
jgi:predicted  nucleic acid-binding Zn-ribbon protein